MVAAIPHDNAQPIGRGYRMQQSWLLQSSVWQWENQSHKMEQEAAKDSAEENSINSVNINPIHFNKNCSVITAIFEMSAGQNNVIVPYKVDTDSIGNIMPLHIYKNVFPKITNEQLVVIKMIVYN